MTDEVARLTKRVLDEVRVEPTCRHLMTVPGVGPLTALAFRATVDRPDRFRRSRDVGAHLGLTPRRYQSGETACRAGSADAATHRGPVGKNAAGIQVYLPAAGVIGRNREGAAPGLVVVRQAAKKMPSDREVVVDAVQPHLDFGFVSPIDAPPLPYGTIKFTTGLPAVSATRSA